MMRNETALNVRYDPASKFWNGMEPRLAVYLRSFAGLSPDDAEDVLQEVGIAYWRDGPDGESDARPWLYRVARNRAIDALRRRKRERAKEAPGSVEPDTLIGTLPARAPSPEALSLDAAETDFVRGFLAGLQDPERELLHLAFAEDLPYVRIAELLGMPLGTVKWRIAALKRRLAARHRREFS